MQKRSGFTLAEVVVALTILTIVMLALITMTGRTMRVSVISDAEQAALQLATDRTDLVKADPFYAKLDSIYGGTETSFPSLPGYTRTTLVVHVLDTIYDYKKITVTVSGPALTTPIKRTVTVSAP